MADRLIRANTEGSWIEIKLIKRMQFVMLLHILTDMFRIGWKLPMNIDVDTGEMTVMRKTWQFIHGFGRKHTTLTSLTTFFDYTREGENAVGDQ